MKEEEGRRIALIQTPSVRENTPLKAKNGVRLNHVPRMEETVEGCLTKGEEGRRIVLIQTPSVRENTPLKAKNGVDLRPKGVR